MRSGLSLALPAPVAPASDRVGTRGLTHLPTAALALASGVLYTLAQPPLDLAHVAWVCLVPLLGAIGTCRTRWGAALCGLGTAMVFSALVAGWLPGAISAFFGVSPVLGWAGAGVVYLAYAGGPYALFAALARGLLQPQPTGASLVGIPALLVATDLLRTHILLGLPWGLLGHALHGSTTLIQVADLAGVSGLSFVIALVNTAVVVALGRRRTPRAVPAPLAVALAVVAATWLYGHARLATGAWASGGHAVRVGVLQPDQAPVYHATPLTGDRALLAQARLSLQQFGGRAVDLVVWPEHAIPFYLERDTRAGTQLRRLAEMLGAPLIVGAPATSDGTPRRYFNAAHLITPDAGATALYRKQRLVPFAEYQPLRPDGAAAHGAAAFSTGDQATIFATAGMRWGPTICLDIIYAGVVRASVRAGAEAIINLSNDSWLAARGGGAAAQQLAQTVFRAVENRRDVVRATTTGISAVVGADGVPRAMLAEHRAGAFVAPVYGRQGLTPYTRCGDVFATGCVLLAALALRRRRNPRPPAMRSATGET